MEVAFNIFVLDRDPELAAQYHCDKHVVKMTLESTQILSTANRLLDYQEGYRITHRSHPCVTWVLQSLDNWLWLRKLAESLNLEYKFRYEKDTDHAAFLVLQQLTVPEIPSLGLTSFVQAMPESCRREYAVEAYRHLYMTEKRYMMSWKRRGVPEWFL